MSSWRVLELSEQPDGEPIPQLLVKPVFNTDSYTVFLTCLTNIWSEVLDLDGIVGRAAEQQSPIEVSQQDPVQLGILLDNVKKSLVSSEGTECRLTRQGADGITLHTTIRLPEPLDSLTWKFNLHRRSPVTLKNELILPLLISSHIQYERINDLITTIENKDNAITRLVDSFESNNLDLAAAFPSIGGLKTGRKLIKREQAARHLPALRPFQQNLWREETAQLADADVTTLGLFQEALAQSTPEVPSSLHADDGAEDWLAAVPSRLVFAKPAIKIKSREFAPPFQPPKHGHESSPVDVDTEDEFEVHKNFRTRPFASKPGVPRISRAKIEAEEEESTDEDDDLDAPSQSQGRIQGPSNNRDPSPSGQRAGSLSLPAPAEPATSPPPVSRPKAKGFRIGGRAKEETSYSPKPEEATTISHEQNEQTQTLIPTSSQIGTQLSASPKKPKKAFKIGGKTKSSQDTALSQREITDSPAPEQFRDIVSPTPRSSPPLMLQDVQEEPPSMEPIREETSEEKAERKRTELKRRNEEIAKKQAQHKKKKRF
ncbi:hypothetical protein E8E13_005478 [Curvularia kusanoi]|uniref:Non-homologous end-joining factor 1 n=1 Tax=Curvularia kusanoi TaxID=90978 RepID=A0A9P4T7Q9_CURKU|nr:hypothetical protein E8E13_005478 [Curvularia kusanoi]